MNEVQNFFSDDRGFIEMHGWYFLSKFDNMSALWDHIMQDNDVRRARDMALRILGHDNVLSKRDRVSLAVQFAERVQRFMHDRRCDFALEVAKKYIHGDATDDELFTAAEDARSAYRDDEPCCFSHPAAACAAYADAQGAALAAGHISDDEFSAQMNILKSIKNPFNQEA